MNLNLTCQRTHILAWINVDNTLSLKLNGVKYVAYPKLDKRGEKYWKCDGLVNSEPKPSTSLNSSLSKRELELVKSYQEKVANNYKMEDFSLDESRAYGKWREEQKAQEQIEKSSQKVADQLSHKIEKNHETNPQ